MGAPVIAGIVVGGVILAYCVWKVRRVIPHMLDGIMEILD